MCARRREPNKSDERLELVAAEVSKFKLLSMMEFCLSDHIDVVVTPPKSINSPPQVLMLHVSFPSHWSWKFILFFCEFQRRFAKAKKFFNFAAITSQIKLKNSFILRMWVCEKLKLMAWTFKEFATMAISEMKKVFGRLDEEKHAHEKEHKTSMKHERVVKKQQQRPLQYVDFCFSGLASDFGPGLAGWEGKTCKRSRNHKKLIRKTRFHRAKFPFLLSRARSIMFLVNVLRWTQLNLHLHTQQALFSLNGWRKSVESHRRGKMRFVFDVHIERLSKNHLV